MAMWMPFGYEGKPGTCIWCGRKLRRRTHVLEEKEEVPRGYHLTGKKVRDPFNRNMRHVAADKLGDYQDGFFCNLRCGQSFGERMAELGHRLQKTQKKTA